MKKNKILLSLLAFFAQASNVHGFIDPIENKELKRYPIFYDDAFNKEPNKSDKCQTICKVLLPHAYRHVTDNQDWKNYINAEDKSWYRENFLNGENPLGNGKKFTNAQQVLCNKFTNAKKILSNRSLFCKKNGPHSSGYSFYKEAKDLNRKLFTENSQQLKSDEFANSQKDNIEIKKTEKKKEVTTPSSILFEKDKDVSLSNPDYVGFGFAAVGVGVIVYGTYEGGKYLYNLYKNLQVKDKESKKASSGSEEVSFL